MVASQFMSVLVNKVGFKMAAKCSALYWFDFTSTVMHSCDYRLVALQIHNVCKNALHMLSESDNRSFHTYVHMYGYNMHVLRTACPTYSVC